MRRELRCLLLPLAPRRPLSLLQQQQRVLWLLLQLLLQWLRELRCLLLPLALRRLLSLLQLLQRILWLLLQ